MQSGKIRFGWGQKKSIGISGIYREGDLHRFPEDRLLELNRMSFVTQLREWCRMIKLSDLIVKSERSTWHSMANKVLLFQKA